MSRHCIQVTWDEVPHLTADQKATMWETIPAYLRDSRTKGSRALGPGAIYPVAESEVVCEPFDLPRHWPRVYALDVGWNRTAAVWGAWDREQDVVYLYGEHYRGQAEPAIHAAAIRARGDWIPGVIDPAARGRSQIDGRQLIQQYRELSLQITEANNAVESGIYEVWMLLSTGRLKVFKTLPNWQIGR